MKIETKFNIEDTVYFMYYNKIREEKVYSIHTNSYFSTADRKIELLIEYTFYNLKEKSNGMSNREKFKEHSVFATKEELLASL